MERTPNNSYLMVVFIMALSLKILINVVLPFTYALIIENNSVIMFNCSLSGMSVFTHFFSGSKKKKTQKYSINMVIHFIYYNFSNISLILFSINTLSSFNYFLSTHFSFITMNLLFLLDILFITVKPSYRLLSYSN